MAIFLHTQAWPECRAFGCESAVISQVVCLWQEAAVQLVYPEFVFAKCEFLDLNSQAQIHVNVPSIGSNGFGPWYHSWYILFSWQLCLACRPWVQAMAICFSAPPWRRAFQCGLQCLQITAHVSQRIRSFTHCQDVRPPPWLIDSLRQVRNCQSIIKLNMQDWSQPVLGHLLVHLFWTHKHRQHLESHRGCQWNKQSVSLGILKSKAIKWPIKFWVAGVLQG